MKLQAWIQMGVERRETTIEIPPEEVRAGRKWIAQNPSQSLEAWLENYVHDWVHAQYGWGWSGGGSDNDFSCMEGSEDGGYGALGVTSDSSIPNTRAIRLDRS